MRGNCDTCAFWDNSARSGASDEETGQCRRNPPGFDSRTGLAVWPFVETGDWCGEYRADPDRIEEETDDVTFDEMTEEELLRGLEAMGAAVTAPVRPPAPITHRCAGTISHCYYPDDVPDLCSRARHADGTFSGVGCGEPCSWIMGKSGHGDPPWENVGGCRRDPRAPDPGFGLPAVS